MRGSQDMFRLFRLAKENKFKDGQLVKAICDITAPRAVIKQGTLCTVTPCNLFFRSDCYDILSVENERDLILFVPEEYLDTV